MRRVGLAATAVLVLLAAACLSVQAGPALERSRPRPVAPGFWAGAMSSPRPSGPSTRLRAPVRSGLAPVTCDGKFDAVSSPNGTGNNVMFGVAAINANDVWAVGFYTGKGNYDRTLAEHWDGNGWVIVPTPNPSAFHSDLYSVSAIATNDVWAVGAYQVNSLVVHGFAEHWNGTTWTLVTATFNPSSFTVLNGVSSASANDVWAVGTYFSGSAYQSLTEHWNGSTWSQFTSVNPSVSNNQLNAVSAFSSTDVWAVGESNTTPPQSMAQHWNGTIWSVVATPNLGTGADNLMFGVAAVESNHAVAVGLGNFVSGITPRESEVWDLQAGGGSTSQFDSGPGSGDNALLAVASSGAGVWAVGYWRSNPTSARQTLVIPATFDSGTHSVTWGSPRLSDSPSSINNALYAVAAITPSVFWATGYTSGPTIDGTLTELYCGVHFNLSAPGTATTGVPFSVNVTAANADASTATRYVGTVHFTSTDPSAVLPADYIFTPGDNGSHTFASVVLNRPYNETITVADTATPFVKGSVTVSARCPGACQSSGGTSGGRNVLPGPPPGPPGRGVAIRPMRLADSGSRAASPGVLNPKASAVAARAGLRVVAAHMGFAGIKASHRHTSSVLAVMQEHDRRGAIQQAIASSPASPFAPSVEGEFFLGLVVFALVALRRLWEGRN